MEKKVNTIFKLESNKNMENWEQFHAQGYAARKKENYTQAIELYTNAIDINPKYFKVINYI